jgi:hypothetical protein
MAENTEKKAEIEILEAQDGSATVDLPEDLQKMVQDSEEPELEGKSDSNSASEEDMDAPEDNEELRQAKRNRRRAKKDLIRKTNQEKDVRLAQLQRENEQFKQRLSQLERNTKAEQITRIDKGIEDAQVRLEYAKMKLSEATQNQDGQAMVDAQTLWQEAREEVRRLSSIRQQADQELKRPAQNANIPDPEVQKLAAQWMRKNNWYNPQASDADSRVAKKMDELMAAEGWNPSDPDYWDELDSRLQKALPHRYNGSHDEDSVVRRPRNVVGSSGREASAAYGGSNRSQFVLSPERVKAMKEAGAWDNPERKARMIKNFMEFDRSSGRRN